MRTISFLSTALAVRMLAMLGFGEAILPTYRANAVRGRMGFLPMRWGKASLPCVVSIIRNR